MRMSQSPIRCHQSEKGHEPKLGDIPKLKIAYICKDRVVSLLFENQNRRKETDRFSSDDTIADHSLCVGFHCLVMNLMNR